MYIRWLTIVLGAVDCGESQECEGARTVDWM